MTPDELAELRRFAAEVEEYESHRDPRREAAEDAEYAKIAAAHPGEYVAFVDAWDGAALTRTVLAHAADLGDLIAAAETWPADVQDRVRTEYIDPRNFSHVGLCLAVEWEEFYVNGQPTRPGR